MNDLKINSLIQDAVKRHCDDPRLIKVIMDILNETNQQYLYDIEIQKRFKTRFNDSILEHFKEELGNA